MVGETPNLASRLQTIAEPGQVVVAEATRRLLGGVFRTLHALTPQTVAKGIGRTYSAPFVGADERASESRFTARAGYQPLPIVGRDSCED